jgi:hypothetical protein
MYGYAEISGKIRFPEYRAREDTQKREEHVPVRQGFVPNKGI